VGKSGSGKSTMLSLLLRFYDPQQGRILIDGEPLTDIQLRSFHDQTAIVAQDTQLFGCSIYDNITYGLDEDSYTYDDVIAVAKKACAHEFITAFPEGYMTRVGERGARLSGGQVRTNNSSYNTLLQYTLVYIANVVSTLSTISRQIAQRLTFSLSECVYVRVYVITEATCSHCASTSAKA
jgi:ABC-type transport system involved in Fe-S cluster assembly fused permease/ATPase subunit